MITEWIVDILHSVYEWAQYPFCNPTRSEIGFWCIRVFAVYLQAVYHQPKSQKVWFLLLTFQASVWASISFTYLKMFIYWGTIRGWHSSRFWGCCCLVIRSCLFCNPMDYSPLGSFVHRISQARIWSGLLFPSLGDLPNLGIEPTSPALAGGFFTTESPGKSLVGPNRQSPFLMEFPLYLRRQEQTSRHIVCAKCYKSYKKGNRIKS